VLQISDSFWLINLLQKERLPNTVDRCPAGSRIYMYMCILYVSINKQQPTTNNHNDDNNNNNKLDLHQEANLAAQIHTVAFEAKLKPSWHRQKKESGFSNVCCQLSQLSKLW